MPHEVLLASAACCDLTSRIYDCVFGCRLCVSHIGSFRTTSLISLHHGAMAIRLLKAADTFWLVIEVCLAFLGCAAFHLNANCAQKTCWAAAL